MALESSPSGPSINVSSRQGHSARWGMPRRRASRACHAPMNRSKMVISCAMAYDQGLAERLRELLDARRGVTEKAMFGGVCFLLGGRMFIGIVKDELMVRVGPDAHDDALGEPHARTMDFTGRPMRGYVFVAPPGFEDDRVLGRWIDRAYQHVVTLPEKGEGKARAKATKNLAKGGEAPAAKGAMKETTKKATKKATKPATGRARR